MKRPVIFMPRLISGLFLVHGFVNLLEALFHKPYDVMNWMEQWVPFEISESSRLLLLGFALLQIILSRALWRQKKIACQLALFTLACGALLHLGRAFDWHHSLSSAICFVLFWQHRSEFRARSDAPSLRLALGMGFTSLLVLALSGYLSLRHFELEISGNQSGTGTLQTVLELIFLQDTDTQYAASSRTLILFHSIQGGALLAGLIFASLALRPVLAGDRPSTETQEKAREIISLHGSDPMNGFAFLQDKHYFFHRGPTSESVVVYALWRNIAVTLADPIGPPVDVPETIRAFHSFCREQDWRAVFYEILPDFRDFYHSCGLKTFKIAEDARLATGTFSLQGGKFQNLRTAQNKAKKAGLSFHWYDGRVIDVALEAQMKLISDRWLLSKHGHEMTFDLGSFSIQSIRGHGAALVLDQEGNVEGFTTWLPYLQGRGRSLDLMRSNVEARGAMDFLIVECIRHFRESGVEEISLGNAPLANTEEDLPEKVEEKGVKYLFENFNHLYGYKSLFEFKKKYQPEWKGRYIAYDGLLHLPAVAAALVRVHTPAGLLKMLRS